MNRHESSDSINDDLIFNVDDDVADLGINEEDDVIIQTDDSAATGADQQFSKKQRKKTSKVWEDMEEVTENGVVKVRCNHCKKLFKKVNGGTTSHLKRHLKICLQRKLKINSTQQQQVLSFNSTHDGNTSITNFVYDHARVRELAAHMTLVHEYPFLHMEHVVFNKFLKAISLFYVPISRHIVKKDCFTTFENEKMMLKITLKGIRRISVTTDCWKSGHHIQYMVVTGHFVDQDWLLQKRVLNFCNVPPPHTGVVIADALSKCFVDWGIEDKVASITVDNAAYNDVCVKRVKTDLERRRTLSIGGKMFHVRCCAHILNLLVQDGLKKIDDVIDTVREGVKYLKHSESRLIEFSKIKNQLRISSKSLTLDCQTRWNGTYMMLAAAVEVKDVFVRYSEIDPGFTYVPTDLEWKKVKEVTKFLGVFNAITNIISGSEYPTANLFLVELYEIKELLNVQALDELSSIRAMAVAMRAKFDKYWGECNVLLSLAAILDPRYKMHVINIAYNIIYGADRAADFVAEITQTLHALYDEYVHAYVSSSDETEKRNLKRGRECGSSNDSSNAVCEIGQRVLTGKVRFHMLMSEVDASPPERSDLDIYLEESRYKCDVDANLDVIAWWKGEQMRFRILSKMASDILSIPITTVASESTFSAGGRVVDDRRASLSVNTVEMLMCARDWCRFSHGLKKNLGINKKRNL